VPSTLLPIPHRPQRSDGDCLAACATMMLDHLGVPVDYDRLLQLLDVKPYGTPGSRLNNLAGLGIGSKGGALHHSWCTSPPSALRTGRATHRCTWLASEALSK
jgi:hypothetical protein